MSACLFASRAEVHHADNKLTNAPHDTGQRPRIVPHAIIVQRGTQILDGAQLVVRGCPARPGLAGDRGLLREARPDHDAPGSWLAAF